MIRSLAVLSLAALGLALPQPAGASPGRLIAPRSACPGQERPRAPLRVQERAMRCMTNFARRRAGRATLRRSPPLDRSARLKSRDIVRCDDFDHEACGRDFAHWIDRVGYPGARCGKLAENIATGTGFYGTVRGIFVAWIHSAGHRRNILGPYRDLGVGLRIGGLDGHRGARVWTQHFGAPCRRGGP